MELPDLENATLKPQSFGLAMSQVVYGGPRGIWLECKCGRSDVIVGSAGKAWVPVTDAQVATIFRRHGWTGEGDRMMKNKCPKCSSGDPQ